MDTSHRKRIFTRSIIPAACQKEIAGRPKMSGMSQFHSSMTGQASANEKSATVHWGTYQGSEFTELESPTTLDTTASSVKLDVIIDGYYYVGAEYLATESAEPQNLSASDVVISSISLSCEIKSE